MFPAKDSTHSQSRRIFIGGIPIKLDESSQNLTISDILKEYFSTYGQISYFKLAKSKKGKEPLGFGFLEFKDDKVSRDVLSKKHIVAGREVLPRTNSRLM